MCVSTYLFAYHIWHGEWCVQGWCWNKAAEVTARALLLWGPCLLLTSTVMPPLTYTLMPASQESCIKVCASLISQLSIPVWSENWKNSGLQLFQAPEVWAHSVPFSAPNWSVKQAYMDETYCNGGLFSESCHRSTHWPRPCLAKHHWLVCFEPCMMWCIVPLSGKHEVAFTQCWCTLLPGLHLIL